jgi:ribosome-binding protein aMBF1 (putative translation factor)
MPSSKNEPMKPVKTPHATSTTSTTSGRSRSTQSQKSRDWRSTVDDLIEEVRRSEVLTREDLAIRINARD